MFYHEKFFRNPFTKAQQAKIRRTVFAIVGLGGTGGFMLESLARMGAEKFILYERDNFELSNFNRQILATGDWLDKPKIKAAVSRARSINDSIKIISKKEFTKSSSLALADLVLDGSDNVPTRVLVAKEARKQKIPYVFCSASTYRGIITVFNKYSFERAFNLPKNADSLEKYAVCSSVICPAAAVSGSLAATLAINFTLGKPHVKAPDALFFDLQRENMFWRAKLV